MRLKEVVLKLTKLLSYYSDLLGLYERGYHTPGGLKSTRLDLQSSGNQPEKAAAIEAFVLISLAAAKLRVASSATSLCLLRGVGNGHFAFSSQLRGSCLVM